ncbi:hypothetical protein Cni_G08512 [Canna indica]|uniref:Transmembrane protein n=1 Tax=Canna indica TaxID=4628 RepID=A0AAQ3K647_9LILI|nr:hypothetical protein Cni_G08512 [Canna indica]
MISAVCSSKDQSRWSSSHSTFLPRQIARALHDDDDDVDAHGLVQKPQVRSTCTQSSSTSLPISQSKITSRHPYFEGSFQCPQKQLQRSHPPPPPPLSRILGHPRYNSLSSLFSFLCLGRRATRRARRHRGEDRTKRKKIRPISVSYCWKQIANMDKGGSVVLDIECLTQQSDLCCSGSPKMTKALSRKGSIRMEKRIGEEKEADNSLKKLIAKVVPSQMEQFKQPILPLKTLQTVQSPPSTPVFPDLGEGRSKRLNRLTIIHPRRILLFFATMSSLGTMVLIYFTLAINRRGGGD